MHFLFFKNSYFETLFVVPQIVTRDFAVNALSTGSDSDSQEPMVSAYEVTSTVNVRYLKKLVIFSPRVSTRFIIAIKSR